VKKGGFFGDFIPHHSQTGNHLSDREKPGTTPPRKYDEPSKNYGSFNLPKFGETNYKEFDETSKSYGSFGLLKFEQTFLQGVRRAKRKLWKF